MNVKSEPWVTNTELSHSVVIQQYINKHALVPFSRLSGHVIVRNKYNKLLYYCGAPSSNALLYKPISVARLIVTKIAATPCIT